MTSRERGPSREKEREGERGGERERDGVERLDMSMKRCGECANCRLVRDGALEGLVQARALRCSEWPAWDGAEGAEEEGGAEEVGGAATASGKGGVEPRKRRDRQEISKLKRKVRESGDHD